MSSPAPCPPPGSLGRTSAAGARRGRFHDGSLRTHGRCLRRTNPPHPAGV